MWQKGLWQVYVYVHSAINKRTFAHSHQKPRTKKKTFVHIIKIHRFSVSNSLEKWKSPMCNRHLILIQRMYVGVSISQRTFLWCCCCCWLSSGNNRRPNGGGLWRWWLFVTAWMYLTQKERLANEHVIEKHVPYVSILLLNYGWN